MRKTHNTGNSLGIAFIFICSIVLLVVGGLFLKLFLLVRESHFDGVHQYIVEVDENPQKSMLVSFMPGNKSVVALTVIGQTNGNTGRYLLIPVNAQVEMPINESISKLISTMLLHSEKEKNITIIDKIRLLLFVNSLKPSDFHLQQITLPVDATVTGKLLPSLFQDNLLYADNQSIAIVNATGESGVGSEVARMLTTIGMNVISVTTADKDEDSTTIIASHGSYTLKKLEDLFQVASSIRQTSAISDITITIGKKSLAQL